MKRNYTAMEYRSIIRRLRAARPDISISSDFIVGFPGETDAGLRADDEARRGRALRRLVQLHLQRRAPARPPPSLPDETPHAVKLARLHAPAEAHPGILRGIFAGDGRHASTRAGRRRCAQGRQRARRAHREQPRRQFRRPSPGSSAASSMWTSRYAYPHSLRGRAVASETQGATSPALQEQFMKASMTQRDPRFGDRSHLRADGSRAAPPSPPKPAPTPTPGPTPTPPGPGPTPPAPAPQSSPPTAATVPLPTTLPGTPQPSPPIPQAKPFAEVDARTRRSCPASSRCTRRTRRSGSSSSPSSSTSPSTSRSTARAASAKRFVYPVHGARLHRGIPQDRRPGADDREEPALPGARRARRSRAPRSRASPTASSAPPPSRASRIPTRKSVLVEAERALPRRHPGRLHDARGDLPRAVRVRPAQLELRRRSRATDDMATLPGLRALRACRRCPRRRRP